MNERDIFERALDLIDAETRAQFLHEACADNDELRCHIEGLLLEHEQLDGFLEAPPLAVGGVATDRCVTVIEGTTVGPYKIREQIGEGGMGVVYVAEQTEPVRRKVALRS